MKTTSCSCGACDDYEPSYPKKTNSISVISIDVEGAFTNKHTERAVEMNATKIKFLKKKLCSIFSTCPKGEACVVIYWCYDYRDGGNISIMLRGGWQTAGNVCSLSRRS